MASYIVNLTKTQSRQHPLIDEFEFQIKQKINCFP